MLAAAAVVGLGVVGVAAAEAARRAVVHRRRLVVVVIVRQRDLTHAQHGIGNIHVQRRATRV